MTLSDLPLEPISPNGVAPSVRMEDGQMVIDWPDPKPAQFMITSEVFEQLITQINLQRKSIATAKKLFTDIGKAAQRLS